jgi:hypothetical protein
MAVILHNNGGQVGKTISHYTIIATKVVPVGKKLSEGAMAIVNNARDLNLNRFVVPKYFTNIHSKDDEEKQRFIQVTKAALAREG